MIGINSFRNSWSHSTQELLEITTNCQSQVQSTSINNDILITRTVAGSEVPSCSYDKRKITNSVKVKRERASIEVKKKPPKNKKFTEEENKHLKAGIEKYGRKNWASIVKDEEFNFHESRTRDSLRMRADSAAFKRLFSNT